MDEAITGEPNLNAPNEQNEQSPPANQAKPALKDRLRWWLLKVISSLSWLYGVSFVVVVLATLLYPFWFNYLIMAIYAVGWGRRLWMRRIRVNVVGKVANERDEALANLTVEVHLLSGDQFAALTRTNVRGQFELYLAPGEIYQITVAGERALTIVDEDGRESAQITNEASHRKQQFSLKVK
jgi:hypothetical protein